jgi:hypothetical protein
MVTKKQLQDDWREKRDACQVRLNALEKEKEQFKSEEIAEQELKERINVLRITMQNLLENKYVGNWGCGDNAYYSRIPENVINVLEAVGIKVEHQTPEWSHVRDVLIDDMYKKGKEIRESSSFQEIEKSIEIGEDMVFNVISSRHAELRNLIEKEKGSIEWYDRRINEVEDRAGLIQWAKHHKENLIRDTQNKKVDDFKDKVRKVLGL